MGLQARLMSQALRKLTAIISKTSTTVVFINQIRMKIGVMFGSPETTTGGNALKFYASVRLDIRRTGTIKKGEEAIGNETKVQIATLNASPQLGSIWEAKKIFNRVEMEGLVLPPEMWEAVLWGKRDDTALKIGRVLVKGWKPDVEGLLLPPMDLDASFSKEGELGRRKITQYTRYGTILLSVVQAYGIAIFLERSTGMQNGAMLVYNPGWGFELMAVLTLTTGSVFVMWLGEQITERGIGNGMSLLIYAGIVASFPTMVLRVLQRDLKLTRAIAELTYTELTTPGSGNACACSRASFGSRSIEIG